jgi:hypothetical protein
MVGAGDDGIKRVRKRCGGRTFLQASLLRVVAGVRTRAFVLASARTPASRSICP